MQVEDNLALISRGRGNYVDLARLQCPSKPARCPDRYGGFSCAQDYYKWTNVQLAKNKELWQARAEGLEQQQRVRGSRSHVPVLLRHGRRLRDGGQCRLLAHQRAHAAAFEIVCKC